VEINIEVCDVDRIRWRNFLIDFVHNHNTSSYYVYDKQNIHLDKKYGKGEGAFHTDHTQNQSTRKDITQE
jgi:hypothetical protein